MGVAPITINKIAPRLNNVTGAEVQSRFHSCPRCPLIKRSTDGDSLPPWHSTVALVLHSAERFRSVNDSNLFCG